jgi:hypothetical protein
MDKQAKAQVDQAVEEAKASPEPELKDLWTDIYYKGTEPPLMRGREREEVCPLLLSTLRPESLLLATTLDPLLLDSGDAQATAVLRLLIPCNYFFTL